MEEWEIKTKNCVYIVSENEYATLAQLAYWGDGSNEAEVDKIIDKMLALSGKDDKETILDAVYDIHEKWIDLWAYEDSVVE